MRQPPSHADSKTAADGRGFARRVREAAGLACVRVYSRLRSTNSTAAALLERGDLPLPAAVIARRQSAGRGRGGNAWWSDAGSLTVTFILPSDPGRPPQELPLRAGLAVRATAGRYVDPARLRIKWPNDLLADGRKLAGVLCERVRGGDLVGIGLNVTTDLAAAPPDVRARAVSLAELAAVTPTVEQAFADLAAALAEAWRCDDWHAELCRAHALTDRTVAVDAGGEIVRGLCRGIAPDGRLLIDDGHAIRAIASGQVVEW